MTAEIRIAISPETLALLEMRMREGDTYDQVIRMLMTETITFPEGMTIDPGAITSLTVRDEAQELRNAKAYHLLLAARAVRDDIARTVDIANLKEWNSRQLDRHIREIACSAVMKAENIVALDAAVKAVFDE